MAAQLASRWGTTKTDAIRRALKSQLSVLQGLHSEKQLALLEVLRTEIWPLLDGRQPLTKAGHEEILGYDPTTGV